MGRGCAADGPRLRGGWAAVARRMGRGCRRRVRADWARTLPDVIDLHTHSTVSDGSDPPERIPELAQAAGCRAVALTDHDRTDGLAAAAARAAKLGIELVRGVEISCEHPGTMHLLVYFLPDEGPLQDELVRLQEARDDRNRHLATRLSDLGLPVTYEEIMEEAGGMGAGRPHIAGVLVRKGVVGSVQEAFDVWLAKGKPAYLDKERLAPEVALRLAVASGAVPVLAHPLSLGLAPAATEAAVAELAGHGLGGLEAWYGRYNPEERTAMAALAGQHGLVATGGSDHHGRYKPDLQVGIGRGDLDVPDTVLEELRGRIPART
ncbi:MAG: PHP domain-containing protein, partial [Actinomycetota bacterium]|nr:PHP domain-containing protein [Actinomycetota bacterium]